MGHPRLPVGHGEDPGRLRISEIFHSLQGESSFTGRPCVFVRLTGCNLRCVWCDTEYSFTGGEPMSIDAVVERVAEHKTSLVEITGGEPLLQKAAPVLAQRLLAAGYTVLCETSGERDISLMPAGVHRIVDLKAPGSGECERNRWANIDALCATDEIKIVVTDRADFDWSIDVITEHKLTSRVPVHLSPVHGQLAAATLADWILQSGLDLRLNLQLHKQLDLP